MSACGCEQLGRDYDETPGSTCPGCGKTNPSLSAPAATPPAARDLERANEILDALAGLTGEPGEIVMQADLAAREIAEAVAAARAEGESAERERCARIVDQVCDPLDNSELGELAADAFNAGGMKRPMAERLKDFGDVISAAIRKLE